MPTENSHNTQHHTPRGGTSRRKPSADANLQAEVELLRANIAKMSEKYEHLHTKNIELEHDYRTLKRNWEKAQAQGCLYPETSKSRLLHISLPKDRPHEPVKVYKD
ncbi:unnamed protein product [Prunus brigantina]